MTGLTGLLYTTVIAPSPYDEAYAENVMSLALDAYLAAAHQYEALAELTDCAGESPGEFEDQCALYEGRQSVRLVSPQTGLYSLERLLKSGEVMSWSQKPMDEEGCRQLLLLESEREEDYELYSSVLMFVMRDERARDIYQGIYVEKLEALLETDARITANLYRIVIAPHETGRYLESKGEGGAFQSACQAAVSQNEYEGEETPEEARKRVIQLEGKRKRLQLEMKECGVMSRYEREGQADH